jgi:hypothetical protein
MVPLGILKRSDAALTDNTELRKNLLSLIGYIVAKSFGKDKETKKLGHPFPQEASLLKVLRVFTRYAPGRVK